MRHLTIIIKPTNRCDANCVYCSAWDPRSGNHTMSDETLRILFQRIEEWVVHSKRTRSLKIIWHGGEPTLMPVKFYYYAIALQEGLKKRHNLEIENNIQSNLLNIDEEKIGMLKKLLSHNGRKKTIGTSFDPIGGVRILKNKDYAAQWEKNIRLLETHDLPYGIVYVVHRRSIEDPETVTGTFLDRFPKTGIRFNPLYREGKAAKDVCRPLYITPAEWGDFLVKLYRIWEAEGKRPGWQPLKEIDEFHHGKGQRMTCDHSGKCGVTHLGIDTCGSVYSCGRGIDRKYKSYGNILNSSIAGILNNPARLEMTNRSAYLQHTFCSGCKWWQYCHGGCPMDAAIDNDNNIFRKTNFCIARRRFFETVYKEPRQ